MTLHTNPTSPAVMSAQELQQCETNATQGYRLSHPGSCDRNRTAACADVKRLVEAHRVLQQTCEQLQREVGRVMGVRRNWHAAVSDIEVHDVEYMRGYIEDFGVDFDTQCQQIKALQAQITKLESTQKTKEVPHV